jgi:chemotaxis protein methyltransferase CheR
MNQHALQSSFVQSILDNKIYQEKIINLIRYRFGIVIHSHQLRELNKIIAEALVKFSMSPEQYLQMLEEAQESTPLLDDLMTKITVGETYFFRDNNQVKLLEEMILPAIVAKKRMINDLNMRIWSAGCASGEEIYTIVMMLTELLPDIDKWQLQLLGTDINTMALRKALKGRYYEWSMRSINDYYKNKFFIKEKNEYILMEGIRDKVDFSYLNLNDDTYPSIFNGTNAQDLILCRNVLIYFDEDNIKHIMKRMCASLIEDGYLLLGASDPMIVKNLDFTFIKNSLYMHKKFNQPIIQQEKKRESKPLLAKSSPVKYKTTRTLNRSHHSNVNTTSDEVTQTMVMSFIHHGKWHDALRAIDNYKKQKTDTFILNAKATILANLGNLEDAIKLCEESIKMDPINIQTHFILAMSLVELNEMKSAEDELRKVIFLDKNYVQAHFQLGLLLLRIKKHDMGIKCLQNALMIAKSSNQTEPVSGFDELTYGKLSEILGREIELHKISKG